MSAGPLIVYHSTNASTPPETLSAFVREHGYRLQIVGDREEVLATVNRTHPGLVVLDGRGDFDAVLDLCDTIKRDPFTAIVPVLIWHQQPDLESVHRAFRAGADEFISQAISEDERRLRIQTIIRRAERDVSVHPTTRLPGTVQIERDISTRLESDEQFAVCYADIDHFKEFNDRYSYRHGDRVILLLSKILRDVVKAYVPNGFIGHIGGDDFIFNVPVDRYDQCCREIIGIFDTLIPFQYTPEDRAAGFFWGKDRRGQLRRVPLMTLSIGIVTNEHRSFSHMAQVSELATEMKAYAKTKEGSLYVVDRRRAGRPEAPEVRAQPTRSGTEEP
jgi:GGDEF domain-containing protein